MFNNWKGYSMICPDLSSGDFVLEGDTESAIA
jgi:hypothetical protein